MIVKEYEFPESKARFGLARGNYCHADYVFNKICQFKIS